MGVLYENVQRLYVADSVSDLLNQYDFERDIFIVGNEKSAVEHFLRRLDRNRHIRKFFARIFGATREFINHQNNCSRIDFYRFGSNETRIKIKNIKKHKKAKKQFFHEKSKKFFRKYFEILVEIYYLLYCFIVL